MDMKKTSINKKSRINLISRLTLLLITVVIWMHSVQGQESTVAKISTPAEVQMQVVTSGHQWHPPFGVDRIGQSSDVIVTIQSRELPEFDK